MDSQLINKKILNVGFVQMTSGQNPFLNLETIMHLLSGVDSTVDLVVLPENSLFFSIKRDSGFHFFTDQSQELVKLKKWVEKSGVCLFLGGIPFKSSASQNKAHNSFIIISPEEGIQSYYNKLHLFCVNVNNEPGVDESKQFLSGEKPALYNFYGWKIGLSICYDLRFSSLFNHYARLGADLLLIPSSFLVPTGRAHWHVLQRARAIESQCYVLAPAQAGVHSFEGSKKHTFGHSLCVDPWGEVLWDLKEQTPAIKVVQLKKSEIAKIRTQIPMAGHRHSQSLFCK